MNTPRPAQWNKAQPPHPNAHRPILGRGVAVVRPSGGGETMTTPSCGHPSNGGELGTYRRGLKFPSAEGWHVVPGWSEISRIYTYSPLSSRAKRGDPVNKKALRAFARKHIALDCHSRTPTFSTLIVLLRNDRERFAPQWKIQKLNRRLHGG